MKKKICSVDGCNNKVHAKDFCNKHYRKYLKYGDPLFFINENHGMKDSSEYITWINMKQRCYNKNNHHYEWYGLRGVIVCDRWKNSFVDFLNDMGYKPFPKAQIDRIDNNKGYYKENCRWVKGVINIRNSSKIKLSISKVKKIRYLSESGMTQKDISILMNVCKSTIGYVINYDIWKPLDQY